LRLRKPFLELCFEEDELVRRTRSRREPMATSHGYLSVELCDLLEKNVDVAREIERSAARRLEGAPL